MTNSSALDPLDCRILAELQRDATLSNAQLAERVGSTGPSCWRRVRAMQDQGLLRRAVWIADPHALGQGVIVLCHVRMREFSAEAIAAFEDFVRAHQQVMECYSMSGEWDYLLRVVASDVADYEHFLMRTLLKHPSVAGASSQFALSTTKYETALPVR
ncbi:Lrp/AsnC family transcriptional regulator [Sphingobium soli]|uniref:Lrp/AsnC family transcriptional regulator n=1 Tax=Sphingobium soli TaxID=1591116 RepID=A0ABS8H7C9_9SPHN|nr:Lrp/AsnC family transcriptional regulator [Sphingobium soli]MCC4234334.1 Lrp/AsnC family transcriptional regulator [Sphingobium soli]